MDIETILSRRRLLLRDGVTFFVLTLITVVLFLVTLGLFHSFSAHRQVLAKRWAERGREALSQGRPEEAVAALRTALIYFPGEWSYELMLAQALGDSGHTEEATNYFLNLWEERPGDGGINLQLARLERCKNEKQEAINHYRAAIYGSWEGDGVVHRRDVRLELANYLIDEKDFATAQTELLIAGSNAPPDAGMEIAFGDELLRAQDPKDALTYYQKAMTAAPRLADGYEKAGRVAYTMGHYAKAREWLERAVRESAGGVLAPGSAGSSERDGTGTLLKNSERLLLLSPSQASNARERVTRELDDKAIAWRRLQACMTQLQAEGSVPAAMQALSSRWTATGTTATRSALTGDQDNEQTLMRLIDDSEVLSAQMCAAPTGDDALLLLLAKNRPEVQP